MTDYLLLRLFGPMASWGEIAVGESRHSAVYPSKSALLGLLGAALGITRDDEQAQHALTHGYRFGIKLVCAGSPLRDYHTIQSPPQRKVRFRTRRHELSSPSTLGTLLSSREYRCDSVALVAVQALDSAPHDLNAVAQALREPHFTLCLGRKSCPLALPLHPRVIASASLRAALDETPQGSLLALSRKNPAQPWPTPADRNAFRPTESRYFWEDGMESGMEASLQLVRHDQPLSRSRWQFAPRREWVFLSGESER